MPLPRFELPSKCQCEDCGYVVREPGRHCVAVLCPKCGGRMRRLMTYLDSR